MEKVESQVLKYNDIQPIVPTFSNTSFEKIDNELVNVLVDCYMLNIETLSSLLNSVVNDLSIVEKNAMISFLNNIFKNLDE
ncbi:MAG: hypothetical protein H6Q15_2041 [Bacteroidetes bacterium]|nr:hypothetical protein [Bacteroidota bacterium]